MPHILECEKLYYKFPVVISTLGRAKLLCRYTLTHTVTRTVRMREYLEMMRIDTISCIVRHLRCT